MRGRRPPAPAWGLLAASLLLLFGPLSGRLLGLEDRAPPAPGGPTYLRDVKPVLDAKCAGCHSEKNLKETDVSGGLALDSLDRIMKGGVVVPGDARGSEVVARLREKEAEFRMPRKAPALPEETIALIERWIDEGAARGEAGPGGGTAPAVVEAVRAPRFRPSRPLDLRIPLDLKIPPGFSRIPREAPREALELRVRVAPLPPVSTVAFSADHLAVGGHGTVTLWDLGKGEAARVLTAVPGTIHGARFSPDGALLAVGGGLPGENGVAAVFETGGWSEVHRFTEHRESVLDLAFSPDGLFLATAGFDKLACLMDLKTGARALTVSDHSDAVRAVAFAAGGKLLATAGADRAVKLTDLATGKAFRTLVGHEKPVLALGADPEGKLLVSSGAEPALRFWAGPEWKPGRQAQGHRGSVEEIAFSRDGKRLASVGSDRSVRIWDAAEGKELKRLDGASDWLYSVAFDPSGRRVAAGAWDGTLRVWDLESGRLLSVLVQPPAGDPSQLDWAAATPEGYFRASAALRDLTRIGGRGSSAPELPAASLDRFLGSAERLASALRGEPVPPPSFPVPRAF